MSWYEQRILPHVTNRACSTKPCRKQREKIVPLAEGDVLEIGFGSGLNLPFYDQQKVRKLWGLEPSEAMRKLAAKNLEGLSLDLEFIDLPGEEITVLVTFTLCTIPDTASALQGMRRVLKPGGRLLFCEHGTAPDEGVRRWQDRLNSGWSKISGGCNMNRDIPALIAAGGFDIDNYWGSAVSA
jgi:ubiquinone/menaquinone biosynthesis C-methylase UbiE